MTQPADSLTTEKKYVLIFDFCSSTSIIEHLMLQEPRDGWRNLLIDIEHFLKIESTAHGFEIYKFIGDGWILLFNTDFAPSELFSLVKRLCDKYESVYNKRIGRILPNQIDNIGITFGLEMGDLIRFEMFEHTEYIGIPLNMAARFQRAIKDHDPKPQGKVLMSMLVYDKVRNHIPKEYRVWRVKRKLRNILGDESIHAIKYEKR